MIESPINLDPHYYKAPDPYGVAEAYLRDIYRNVHEKKFSYLSTLTGAHRVGKSVGAVTFADILDPTFDESMEKRVVYEADEFSEAVEEIRKDHIIGGAIVWDESNLGLSSRNWYTIANKHINFTIQAFGYIRPMVFFVTQDVTFIDSQPRKLFHDFLEIKRTDNTCSKIYPFDIRINKRTGKIYYVYPRFHSLYKGGQGARLILRPLKLMKPPKPLIDRYEKHSRIKKEHLMKQNEDMIKAMKQHADPDYKKERLSEDEIIQHCIAEKDNPLFINNRGEYRHDTIAQEFKIPYRYAKMLKIKCDVKLKQIREDLE